MSEGAITIKKAIPIIIAAWVLSLITTLALVYIAPGVFPPLNSANINTGAVITEKIADNAVVTTKLADGSITSAKIFDGTILAEDLGDNSIITVKIVNGSITTDKIFDESITTDKIANGSVITQNIADRAIVTIKLADGSVTSAKILNGSIIAEDLATDSIVTISITDGAVTTSKIADYAVTSIKLAQQAIPFASAYSSSGANITSSALQDLPGMTVNLTLNRTSNVLILFNTDAHFDAASDALLVSAKVGTLEASPTIAVLANQVIANMTVGSTFFKTNVPAGNYTVKIQGMTTGTECYTYRRTMVVIALPA